jgi:NAD(P)-dependent dehydrogenase (short-subunit alcohol dehydrogenase family)
MKLSGGSIVNIGSMWAKQAVKHLLQLILCKSRLTLFTQHLAMELADYNIRVNAVSPAVVNTTLYHGVFGGKEAAEKALEGFNGFHPIGKIGSADEVANAVVFIIG